MAELLHAYHTLFLMMIGLGLIVGLVSRKKAFHALKHMVLVMIAMPFVLSAVSATWTATPLITRFLVVAVGLPIAAMAALVGTTAGREFVIGIASNWAYDWLRRPGCVSRFVLLLVVLGAVLAVLL